MYCRPVYYKGLSYVSYVRRTLIQSNVNIHLMYSAQLPITQGPIYPKPHTHT